MIDTRKSTILFVDDDHNVLQGLKRALRPLNRQWNMLFVESGENALDAMETNTCDVLITDMCMPGMNGAELLEIVRRQYPETVRMTLSGQTDRKAVLETFGTAHFYLSKPCGPESIMSAVNRGLNTQRLLPEVTIRRMVSRIQFLPCQPDLLDALFQEMVAPKPDIDRMADIVCNDLGLAVKILQIVNSPFFGLPRQELDIHKAVTLLGLERISTIAKSYKANFDSVKRTLPLLLLEKIWRHDLLAARIGRMVAASMEWDRPLCAAAYTVGLLQDTGMLALGMEFPDELAGCLAQVPELNVPFNQLETKTFQVSHAELGARLLALWGLPDDLVMPIEFHHNPQDCEKKELRLLDVAHLACVLAHQTCVPGTAHLFGGLASDYLADSGLVNFLPAWERASMEILENLEKRD